MRQGHSGDQALLISWPIVMEHYQLSRTEATVAGLLFAGKTRKQIADILDRAPGTIRVFIDRLYRKLAVTDRLSMALCLTKFWTDKDLSEETPS